MNNQAGDAALLVLGSAIGRMSGPDPAQAEELARDLLSAALSDASGMLVHRPHVRALAQACVEAAAITPALES